MGSMKDNIRTTLFGITVFLILFSCGNDKPAVIATVGSASISQGEYQRRFNFNSVFPSEVPLAQQKELVLSSLLAEKVLMLYTNPDSVSNEVRIAREQTWREVLIEELRLDSVERQIVIDEADLKREYEKSLWDINIKYLAFNDSSEAWRIYHEATAPNGSFNTTARNYLNHIGHPTESIPVRCVKSGSESIDLENKVYNMADGQIGTPFFVYDQYYVIQHEGAIANISATPPNYEVRRSAMREKVFRQLVKKKYRGFYSRQILPQLGKISWERLQPIYDDLYAEAHFDTKKETQSSLKKPLNKEIYLNGNDRYAALLKKDAIVFAHGNTMTVEKVLERLAFGPYVFDYSNARNFKKSFFNMVHLMVEHETIFEKAMHDGYAKDQNVNQKMIEWDSYYSATDKKHALLRASAGKSSQDVLEAFLMKNIFQLKIKLYPKVLENIELQPAEVLVRKSHFANRLVAAPVQSFMGLHSWEKYVKTLLQEARS